MILDSTKKPLWQRIIAFFWPHPAMRPPRPAWMDETPISRRPIPKALLLQPPIFVRSARWVTIPGECHVRLSEAIVSRGHYVRLDAFVGVNE